MESQTAGRGSNHGGVAALKFAREGTLFLSQTRAGTRRDFKLATEETWPSRANLNTPTGPRYSTRDAESFPEKNIFDQFGPGRVGPGPGGVTYSQKKTKKKFDQFGPGRVRAGSGSGPGPGHGSLVIMGHHGSTRAFLQKNIF